MWIDLAFLTSALRLFYSFMQLGENVVLKDFVIEGMEFMFVVIADLLRGKC